MVRCIGRLLFLVEHRGAADWASTRTEHALWVFLLAPPQDLIEPVHAPVAESAVRVIEEIAPPTWMQFAIEWPQRGRPAPQIPIHFVRRLAIGSGIFLCAAAVREQPHHADLTDSARF